MIGMKLRIIALLASALAIMAPAAGALADTSVQNSINNSLKCGSNLQLTPNGGNCDIGQSTTDFNKKIQHFINLISAVVGLVAVVMIIFGGFRYVTSGGSDTSVTSAKNTILYAIIGLIIVAMSQLLVHFVIGNLTS